MSLVNNKEKTKEAVLEKSEVARPSPSPSREGAPAPKGAFQGATMAEGTQCVRLPLSALLAEPQPPLEPS